MNILDLYSGAGGMSCGMRAVFPGSSHYAIEMWGQAASTWKENFGGDMVVGAVEESICKMGERMDGVDLIIGGPPCQGFSLLNPANWNDREADPRNSEWSHFLDAVERFTPSAWVMENVTAMAGTSVLDAIVERGESLGYKVGHSTLKACDFGAPTSRKRLIIVGGPKEWHPPIPTHGGGDLLGELLPLVSVKDAIGDLPPATEKGSKTMSLHYFADTKKDRERCALVPLEVEDRLGWLRNRHPDLIWPTYRKREGGFFTTAYGRMDWEGIAPTITTKFLDPSAGKFTHPDGQRTITLREGARLQTFPDDFVFTGGDKAIAKQIGNAVPPVLAQAVGISIKNFM